MDNLTGVTQSGLNPRTFSYDSLSRLTTATNPESGTINYVYDSNGNLQTKTDARGITTTYGYDALNRLTGKTYSDGTPSVTFNYDQSGAYGVSLLNTTGRMSSETSASPNPTGKIFSYDQLGRIKVNSQCTPQNCGANTVFPVTFTYDFVGDMLTGTNGVGITFSYSYNVAPRLTTLTSSLSGHTHPSPLISAAHYNSAGSLLSASLGNGVSESRTYDSRLRIAAINDGSAYSVTIPASGGYVPNSDILAATDSVNGNWTYSYDDFNRLLTANATGQAYTFDYDRYGNRWHQNGPHSSQLGFDANNHITGVSGMGYDAAGNMTSDGIASHTYFYDAENRITQVDGTLNNCSTATACYVYNAEGQRVRKTTGSTSVDYLYDLSGNEITELSSSGAWNRAEIYAGARHVATYSGGTSGTSYFNLSDWLGTERVRTTPSKGSVYETCTSLPFGDALSCSATDISPMHFTGKERDSESGLDNFLARYNSSSLGRFMSPDPIGGQKIDPQTLNKYSYVRNNPVNFTDPTGLYTCKDDNNKCESKQDKAFEKARQQDLKSKDPDVVRAAKAYGDRTKDNHVSVGFADLDKKGEGGVTTSTLGADDKGNLFARSDVTINSKLSGSALDAAVGHEGSHVADAQDVASSISLTNTAPYFKIGMDITRYQSEQRAYAVTDSILKSGNENWHFACGLSDCVLGTGQQMLSQRAGVIDRIMANSPLYRSNGQPLSSTNQGGSVVKVVPQ